jgi:hypothetical protein
MPAREKESISDPPSAPPHASPHTFFLVVRRKRHVEQPALRPEPLAQADLERGIDRLLGHLHRDLALARDDLRHRDGLVDDVDVGLDDARDDAPALRLLRGELPAGEHELHRAALADRMQQALRAAAAGDRADVDLGLAELGARRREDDVRRERDLAAAAELDGSSYRAVVSARASEQSCEGQRGKAREDGRRTA